jgi:hypothetical protein
MKSFRSFITDSVDAEKEYGASFVASAKSVGAQRKLTKELGVKLKEVEKSLGHGGGGNGLTPDDVKSNPKWKAAKKALDVSFKKEQQMNQAMSKAFGKQMKDFRNKDRRGYMSLFIGESSEAARPTIKWKKVPDGYDSNRRVFKHVTSDGKYEIRLSGMDSMKFNKDGSRKVLPTVFDTSGQTPRYPVTGYKNVAAAKAEVQRWIDDHEKV